MRDIRFDYFWGMEAEKFSFYRVPKVLFTEEYFKTLSCEAKVLYGLMLDRMGLSLKNRWLDESGRVYIIFTIEEIMELLCCRSQKAVKLVKELDVESGFGLIERKRLGLGKPNVIYVKNFMLKETVSLQESEMREEQYHSGGSHEEILNVSDQNQSSNILKIKSQKGLRAESRMVKDQEHEISGREIDGGLESKIQNFEIHNSGTTRIKNPEFPGSKVQSFENQKSGLLRIGNQEIRKSKSNKTDNIKTDMNETDFPYLHPIYQGIEHSSETQNAMDKMNVYREMIRKNISYECFQDEKYCGIEDVDELVELIVEVFMMPDDAIVRIGGQKKTAVVVKGRFMRITQPHIQYVINCLQNNTNKVKNIKAYLLTTLYNSTLTMGNYYRAEVNHELYGESDEIK